MPKITTIKDYLSQEELHERYRQADKVAERTHWHIIWLLSSGKRVKEVAQITDYTEGWIRELVRRYNQTGAKRLRRPASPYHRGLHPYFPLTYKVS